MCTCDGVAGGDGKLKKREEESTQDSFPIRAVRVMPASSLPADSFTSLAPAPIVPVPTLASPTPESTAAHNTPSLVRCTLGGRKQQRLGAPGATGDPEQSPGGPQTTSSR
ncbi:Hypothetical predicted protein [Pelobates cultripes]|uniref:Uncharacterized protein n=1 Tax=Pelobates cultripes TaxID=61616 RepID=A0AAD1R1Y7_PELCU|nr:Hypothetical predicted protein [Pelobates cultripes]